MNSPVPALDAGPGPLDNLNDLSAEDPFAGAMAAHPPMHNTALAQAAPAWAQNAPRKRSFRISGKTMLIAGLSGLVLSAIVGIVLVAVLFLPSFDLGPLSVTIPGITGYSTPEAAWQAFADAVTTQNWSKLYSLISPESKERLVATLATTLRNVPASSSDPDVKAFLEKHKIGGPDMNLFEIMAETEEANRKRGEVFASIRNPRAFFVDFMELTEKKGEERESKTGLPPPRQLFAGDVPKVLENVVVKGDLAVAKATVKKTTENGQSTRTSEHHFKRVNGSWYIHQPTAAERKILSSNSADNQPAPGATP